MYFWRTILLEIRRVRLSYGPPSNSSSQEPGFPSKILAMGAVLLDTGNEVRRTLGPFPTPELPACVP